MTIAEREDTQTLEANLKLLSNITQEIYQNNSRGFEPLYPRVLVYVCERAQQIGSILLPEKQNKVNLEGIVLATWKPFTETKTVYSGGVCQEITIEHRSEVKPGDHVLFPHSAGLPEGNILPDKQFRIINETDDAVPGILAVIGYEPHERMKRLEAELEKIIFGSTPNPKMIERVLTLLDREFVLVDRRTNSVTTSGA